MRTRRRCLRADEFQRERSSSSSDPAACSSGADIERQNSRCRLCDLAPPRRPGSAATADTDAADVIYTTPLKALSNHKYHDLCDGSVSSHRIDHRRAHAQRWRAVLVMTTEILRNVLYDEPSRRPSRRRRLDEVHYIDELPAGTVWEELIIEAPRTFA